MEMLERIRTDALLLAEKNAFQTYLQITRNQRDEGIVDEMRLLSYLSHPDTAGYVEWVRSQPQDSLQEKSLDSLYTALICSAEGESLSEISREIAVKEQASVESGTDSVPFSRCIPLFMSEPDRSKRREIMMSRDRYLSELTPLYEERRKKLREFSSRYSEEEYASYKCRILKLDRSALLSLANGILGKTKEIYYKMLEYYLDRWPGVSLEEAEYHDLIYLVGMDQQCEAYELPIDFGSVQYELNLAGIDIQAGGRISYEVSPGTAGGSRAFCFPLSMPRNIVLYSSGNRGAGAYYNVHHELGHALHFSHIDDELPFEFKILGDDSVTEGYAMMFGGLATDPVWIRSITGRDLNRDTIRFSAFKELYLFRRYCVTLINSLQTREETDQDDSPQRYRQRFEDACGVSVHPLNSYADYDWNIYSARYIRGWIFGANLYHMFVDRFGDRWFRNGDAGTLLKQMWSLGQRMDADEFMRHFFSRELDTDLYCDKIERALNV